MESAAQNNKQATLPVPTGFGSVVNVNTASAEVIAAKGGIPLNVAQRMISYRNSQPFKTTQDITTFLTTNGVNTSSNNTPNKNGPTLNISGLGVSSSYFTIHAVVDDQADQFRWVGFVYRQNRSGQWPQILWQHPE
jgi:type II secretory pathway component PulK